jgi:hypothetical protein
MNALTFMCALFHTAGAEQNVARVVTQARAPRVVNLNAMRIAERPTEQERRQRACRGHIAEMTERQAGL